MIAGFSCHHEEQIAETIQIGDKIRRLGCGTAKRDQTSFRPTADRSGKMQHCREPVFTGNNELCKRWQFQTDAVNVRFDLLNVFQ